MIAFPNAKINLGLSVAKKRSDGYHSIESVFFPVSICDVLEVIERKRPEQDDINIAMYGTSIPGSSETNLCIEAYHLLKKDFPLTPVDIHLYKKIPVGAGLGGGSSDGAYTLRLLDELFKLHLSVEQLCNYAAQLGSDCPFFIYNKPMLAKGRGEELEEVQVDLTNYKIEMNFPSIHISTAEAFSGVKPGRLSASIREIVQLPVEEWKDLLINDFEESIFEKHPEIKNEKENMYKRGALYASMTGSGSAVYGIFKK